jgi:hypothetical protein
MESSVESADYWMWSSADPQWYIVHFLLTLHSEGVRVIHLSL